MQADKNLSAGNGEFMQMKGSYGLDANHLKTITDSVPQLIWENNPLGEAVYFNKRWFDFSGLS